MQRSTFHILSGIVAAMWLGILYFLSLIAHLPVWVPLIAGIALCIPGYRKMAAAIRPAIDQSPVRTSKWYLWLLTGAIVLITRSALLQVYIHGSNDALGMWDYYARFLAGDGWERLFGVTGYYHPNHPLGLSLFTGMGWRIMGSFTTLWPVALSFLPLLLIPIIIFAETWKNSFLFSTLVLILFATDLGFHGYSLARMADLWLGLCLLGAFITMRAYKRTGNAAVLFLCASLLGCCLWLKNEGLLLALIFSLFHVKELTRRHLIPAVLAGLLPFLLLLTGYKLGYATPNDLFQPGGVNVAKALTNRHAYGKIFLYLREELHRHFYMIQAGTLLYLLFTVIRRRWPSKEISCLIVSLLAMLSVYLITPTDLDWQLGTSLSRILFELMPSFVFSLVMVFTGTPQQPAGSFRKPSGI